MLKSFNFIFNAIRNKKTELLISLAMVLILLIVASTSMFFLEHKAQPEAFTSIAATMWWGVATLTTVGYGDIYPITAAGKLLGGIIAILGVGLFALPAGIIASGFVEEIENDKKLKNIKENESKLKHAFFVEYFVPVLNKKKSLNLEHVPRKWLSMSDIKYKIGMSEDNVLDVIAHSDLFRLRNVKFSGVDKAGLEYIDSNRSYGKCINRDSDLTIINLYASIQPFFGHFTHVLADLLGANYISNEVYSKLSFIKEKQLNLINNKDYFEDRDSHFSLSEIKSDLNMLEGKGKTCLFFVNAADNENLLQFNTGAVVGDSDFDEGVFYKENLNQLHKVFDNAVEMAQLYEKKAIKHEKSGNPDKDHLCWYIHQENNCNLLMLHVNVGILKKKAKVYYQHIQEFAHCLSELKNKKD